MKTEFLKNFKVNDQELPKDIIDAILAENGRDVEALKEQLKAANDKLKTAQDGLKAFEGVDVAQLQGKITDLQKQLTDKDAEWQIKMDNMAFDSRIKDAITAAKGKSHKAISALLDLDALKASKNQEADIKAALEALQKESGYLFEDEQGNPPPYAGGTGTGGGGNNSGLAAIRAAAGLKND